MRRRTVLSLGLATSAVAVTSPYLSSPSAVATPPGHSLTAWLSHQDIQQLKHRVKKDASPTGAAWEQLVVAKRSADLARAADQTPVEALFYVGPYYETPPELLKLSHRFRWDAHAAYRLALSYAVTSNRKFAEAAKSLILRWQAIEEFSPKDDTPLVWANQFPEFCWAAEILRRNSPVWKKADEATFSDLIRRGMALDPSARSNNWGSWGVVLRLTSTAYLSDQHGFQSGVSRWKELLDSQFDDRGWQPEEIPRNGDTGNRGIVYTHFNLHPLTLAAEIASHNGIDLFNHRSRAGIRIADGAAVAMRWTVDPTRFSEDTGYWPDDYESYRVNGAIPSYSYGYGEILEPHFPNADFRSLAAQDRPLSFNWTGSILTVTHGVAF
ncbi:alginate lyase family protein [Brachybacterium vulturis]|uniref:alginate lyase family protein n=1 Tax=Brachybacterium vulturis TaxID=2017484 RepID=UPI0012FDFCEB|nr:alginate lyase family protein [Brachybacterium vulturis]